MKLICIYYKIEHQNLFLSVIPSDNEKKQHQFKDWIQPVLSACIYLILMYDIQAYIYSEYFDSDDYNHIETT